MNRKKFYLIEVGLCFVLFSLVTTALSAERITVVTEDFPPFNYKKENLMTGISTEVVQVVMQKLGMKAEIRMYPWARAYKMALKQKNILIYSINRIEERENLFKWIGIVAPFKVYLYKLKEREGIHISSMNDLKKYRIGGLRQDARTQFLMQHGIQVKEFNTNEQVIKHLCCRKTIDIIAHDEAAFIYKIKEMNIDPAIFKQAYYLQEFSSELYMAFSLRTDDVLVDKFRQALEIIKKDGTYNRIMKKYFKNE